MVRDLVVALDYGQFYLHTANGDPDLTIEVLARAQDADGVAQDDGLTVILSPRQYDSGMRLAVEVWNGAPPDDLPEWQEAFEVHIDVTDYGLRYESPTLNGVMISVPAGSYDAAVTGRGFHAHQWPNRSTAPGDEWRIRLWPSTGPDRARRLRRFIVEEPTLPDSLHLDAGRAAAARINADLDGGPGARSLSDQTGTARTQRMFSASRRKLFMYAADLGLWSSASSSRAGGIAPGGGFTLSHNDARDDYFDGIPTGHGHVRATYLAVDEPESITTEWQWCTGQIFGDAAAPLPFAGRANRRPHSAARIDRREW
jgi:hypothetical protein